MDIKIAEDFRKIARESLTGKWFIAVLVGFVTSLLGGLASEGPKVKINIDASNADVSFSFAGQNLFSTGSVFSILQRSIGNGILS